MSFQQYSKLYSIFLTRAALYMLNKFENVRGNEKAKVEYTPGMMIMIIVQRSKIRNPKMIQIREIGLILGLC